MNGLRTVSICQHGFTFSVSDVPNVSRLLARRDGILSFGVSKTNKIGILPPVAKRIGGSFFHHKGEPSSRNPDFRHLPDDE